MTNKWLPYATEIAELVKQRNVAYGDAFAKTGDILRILYPDGVPPKQYDYMLTFARMLDKMFRIATDKDAFGESPWRDMLGYSLLAVEREERQKLKITTTAGNYRGPKPFHSKIDPPMEL